MSNFLWLPLGSSEALSAAVGWVRTEHITRGCPLTDAMEQACVRYVVDGAELAHAYYESYPEAAHGIQKDKEQR